MLHSCGGKVVSMSYRSFADKSGTTQNLAFFLSYWYGKKRLQMHFLTGVVS